MKNQEIKAFLEGIARNYGKNAGIMKINTFNNVERIVRKCLGGQIETTVLNAAGQSVTLRVKSVPAPWKDQTFHRLELEADFGAGMHKITPDMLDLESVLNLYESVYASAEMDLEEKTES